MAQPPRLAIVIPAFKADFLRETLDSIEKQTHKDFNLYIGDDCGDKEIPSIVKEFEPKINLFYKRFDNNLGGKSLTKQWERCIALSEEEPYIWLFSDDDIMPLDSISRFNDVQKQNESATVFRFPIELINKNGKVVGLNKETPSEETGSAFLLRRLNGSVHSAITEFIFSRKAYKQLNGFVEFPLAWGSDTATMALYAKHLPIIAIPGKAVQWRTTDSSNISSSDKLNDLKFKAHYLFLEWIKENFKEFYGNTLEKSIVYYLEFVYAHILRFKLPKKAYKKLKIFLRNNFGNFRGTRYYINLILKFKIYYPYRFIRRVIVRFIRNKIIYRYDF